MSDRPALGEWLAEAPFALTMSSGFFAFFAHTGFLSALLSAGLTPSRVSGSSAGALVGGIWASGVEPDAIADELNGLQRRDFWDPGFGPGVLRGRLFLERVRRLVAGRRFEDCRVPTAVSVFDVRRRATAVIQEGDVAAALCASCSVPFLFQPVRIAGRLYLDGGVLDRPGLCGMPGDVPRVLYHHIASRSPWRMKLEMPERAGMVTFRIDDLPRSGPFALEAGRRAYHVAYEATKRALDRSVPADRLVAA